MFFDTAFSAIFLFAQLTTLLVTGLLFTFALLVMPGLSKLEDRAFLRAFQGIDAIIQRSHPLFVTVWMGSIVSLPTSLLLSFWPGGGIPQGLLLSATILYFLGVQLPTFLGNVPLNNQLQRLDLSTASEIELSAARRAFEGPWNRLNLFRTAMALLVSLHLLLIGSLA